MSPETLIKEQVCFIWQICFKFLSFRKWWVWLFDGMALVDRTSNKLDLQEFLFYFMYFEIVIVGEAANFTAYGFAPAILVTPLGALSVIVR